MPAGTLHTIGEGITLIELQEPSDMSVVIEWRYAGVDRPTRRNLKLGWDTILPAADIEAGVPIHITGADPAEPAARRQKRLLPPEADAYFRAELLTIHAQDPLELEAAVLDPDRHRRRAHADQPSDEHPPSLRGHRRR